MDYHVFCLGVSRHIETFLVLMFFYQCDGLCMRGIIAFTSIRVCVSCCIDHCLLFAVNNSEVLFLALISSFSRACYSGSLTLPATAAVLCIHTLLLCGMRATYYALLQDFAALITA